MTDNSLPENGLGEAEAVVEYAVKMQLIKFAYQMLDIFHKRTVEIWVKCPLCPVRNHKDAYILHDI